MPTTFVSHCIGSGRHGPDPSKVTCVDSTNWFWSYPPTWLLKECSSVLVTTITNIVNFSLTSGQFHPILRESIRSPLLKKSTVDKDELSNYCPIPNLCVISKIIECIVKSSLTDNITSNKLLNLHQSAYCKHHSTETALLYIHDHLINAIWSHKKVARLCLLDLSAAFDTIDHNILVTRLSSWFGIHGSVLSWFKSYLSSCSFRVKYDKTPLILSYFLLWCSPKLCSRPSALCHVHYPSRYSYLFPFPWPTPDTHSFSLSTHSTITQAFLTFKMLFNRSLPGWLLIFLFFTPLRLNSCL